MTTAINSKADIVEDIAEDEINEERIPDSDWETVGIFLSYLDNAKLLIGEFGTGGVISCMASASPQLTDKFESALCLGTEDALRRFVSGDIFRPEGACDLADTVYALHKPRNNSLTLGIIGEFPNGVNLALVLRDPNGRILDSDVIFTGPEEVETDFQLWCEDLTEDIIEETIEFLNSYCAEIGNDNSVSGTENQQPVAAS